MFRTPMLTVLKLYLFFPLTLDFAVYNLPDRRLCLKVQCLLSDILYDIFELRVILNPGF